MYVNIIGAGLAGVEASYYLANKNIKVRLYEMRPKKFTEAHKTPLFAELVCSNSLRSSDPLNAVGMLKEELTLLDSLVMEAALKTQVEAGSSLAVDRTLFSTYITGKLIFHPNIEVIHEEVTTIDPNQPTIIATGPLISEPLRNHLKDLLKLDELHFYDAVAPIIEESSIDKSICYLKSRYDKGEAAYLNCPMTYDQYKAFHEALVSAEVAPLKDFELNVFEGCLPIEVMAKRGFDTLTYGPLKPVGLEKDNKPFAVVQLRQDDALKSMYNMVGFQTNLKFGEQRRIIKMIPGLENANILRYGVMHQNTYFNSPKVLNACYQVKDLPNVFIAGQLSGVEGYVESASSGLSCAYHMYRYLNNLKLTPFPNTTIIGALAHYIATPNSKFNPMNANLGLLSPLEKHKKSQRRQLYHTRSIETLKDYLNG
ncbi:MAG: methylenetetrahydrofolate--tRNA-(uracil(54)-C(5))-methyltransferase (FADH(2)-oxidizing) TrmFO [Acholeplasmataceae bacterium]